MKPNLSALLIALTIALGGVSLIGCSSNNQSPGDQGSTAGGNGAFGESPARPGSHAGDQYNQQGVTPTTQPSGS
jgi:hypothetical protein